MRPLGIRAAHWLSLPPPARSPQADRGIRAPSSLWGETGQTKGCNRWLIQKKGEWVGSPRREGTKRSKDKDTKKRAAVRQYPPILITPPPNRCPPPSRPICSAACPSSQFDPHPFGQLTLNLLSLFGQTRPTPTTPRDMSFNCGRKC